MTIDGLAGGILPSWEGVLKLETRAEFHLGTTHLMEMMMMIALNSSFREDQNWSKDHLIRTNISMILNLCPPMCKLFRSASAKCRLKKPNGRVSSPTTNCINRSDLTPHLDIHHSHILLSLFIKLVRTTWAASLSLTRAARRTKFLG